MSTEITARKPLMFLRVEAERLLDAGAAPTTRFAPIGASTMAVLHDFASDSTRSGDALKMLHELQVHQVELDLQYDQLESNQREVLAALSHYEELFECAPISYFKIAPDGRITDSNIVTGELFGMNRDEVSGRAFNSLLAAECWPDFEAMRKRLRSSTAVESCKVVCASGNHLRLRLKAKNLPNGFLALIALLITDA
jgi:PAS domain S-box-containing protein